MPAGAPTPPARIDSAHGGPTRESSFLSHRKMNVRDRTGPAMDFFHIVSHAGTAGTSRAVDAWCEVGGPSCLGFHRGCPRTSHHGSRPLYVPAGITEFPSKS